MARLCNACLASDGRGEKRCGPGFSSWLPASLGVLSLSSLLGRNFSGELIIKATLMCLGWVF